MKTKIDKFLFIYKNILKENTIVLKVQNTAYKEKT